MLSKSVLKFQVNSSGLSSDMKSNCLIKKKKNSNSKFRMIFLKEKRKKIMYINLATHTSQLQYNADKHNVISCIIYCNSRLLLLFT